jgi:hypothetical protein
MKKTPFLTLLLLLQLAFILVFSLSAFQKQGPDLFQFFIGNIVAMNWSGQFNVDFICYLMLSGFWIMWRSKFSIGSVILGFAAMILGILLILKLVTI